MNKRGAKGYWISTAKIINQDLFDKYVNKVGPWLKEVGGQVFAKDTEPQGKERTEDANLAVICEFPSMRAAVEASEKFKSNVTKLSPEAVTFVDDETELIAIALAAADALSDAPTATSFILMS